MAVAAGRINSAPFVVKQSSAISFQPLAQTACYRRASGLAYSPTLCDRFRRSIAKVNLIIKPAKS
jgi:hypothetical protein